MARLTHSDRIKMEALLNAGHSVKEIANQLHVHQATIYREYNRGKYMHRNSDYTEEERYSSDLGQQAHDWYITGKGRPVNYSPPSRCTRLEEGASIRRSLVSRLRGVKFTGRFLTVQTLQTILCSELTPASQPVLCKVILYSQYILSECCV